MGGECAHFAMAAGVRARHFVKRAVAVEQGAFGDDLALAARPAGGEQFFVAIVQARQAEPGNL